VSPTDLQRLPASVIIPAFNAADTLEACLEALHTQTADAGSYEIIVVDDGSTDGTAEIATRQRATVLRQDHAGAAAARNMGAARARGEILLFTDADCEPLPDWIEQMLAPFADPEVSGAKGIYRTRQPSPVARFAQAEYEEKYDRLAHEGQIDFVDTYAAAYRRHVFLAHGGFDPEFLIDEDQEFSFRLASAGHKLVFVPRAAVYHRHQATVWGYVRRKVQIGYWKVRVHTRHPAKAVRDSYTPWTQKAQLFLLPLAGAAFVAAALGLVSGWVPGVLILLGLVSIGPLALKSARQGWTVLLLAPLLVLLRALALGVGMGLGLMRQGRLLPFARR
jgi:cellulose synthase/poly-beta-1,6-N-acetylglucosamine synthase-like glycosyltransferase